MTTIGVVKDVKFEFNDEEEFVNYCYKRSIFPEQDLRKMWHHNQNKKPFAVNFLYIYSFPNRINMEKLIEMQILNGINDAPRGFRPITKEQFYQILKETKSNDSFVIN